MRPHVRTSARLGAAAAVVLALMIPSVARAAGGSTFDVTPAGGSATVIASSGGVIDYGSNPPTTITITLFNGWSPGGLFTATPVGPSGQKPVAVYVGGSVGWNPTLGSFTPPSPIVLSMAAPVTWSLKLAWTGGEVDVVVKDEAFSDQAAPTTSVPPPPAPAPRAPGPATSAPPVQQAVQTVAQTAAQPPATATRPKTAAPAVGAGAAPSPPAPTASPETSAPPPSVAPPLVVVSTVPSPAVSPPRVPVKALAAGRNSNKGGGLPWLVYGVVLLAVLVAAGGILRTRRRASVDAREIA